jgi:hypothetical protein
VLVQMHSAYMRRCAWTQTERGATNEKRLGYCCSLWPARCILRAVQRGVLKSRYRVSREPSGALLVRMAPTHHIALKGCVLPTLVLAIIGSLIAYFGNAPNRRGVFHCGNRHWLPTIYERLASALVTDAERKTRPEPGRRRRKRRSSRPRSGGRLTRRSLLPFPITRS